MVTVIRIIVNNPFRSVNSGDCMTINGLYLFSSQAKVIVNNNIVSIVILIILVIPGHQDGKFLAEGLAPGIARDALDPFIDRHFGNGGVPKCGPVYGQIRGLRRQGRPKAAQAQQHRQRRSRCPAERMLALHIVISLRDCSQFCGIVRHGQSCRPRRAALRASGSKALALPSPAAANRRKPVRGGKGGVRQITSSGYCRRAC